MSGRAGPLVYVVEHQASCGLGTFGTALGESGLRLRVLRPYQGEELTPALDGDGLIVLGGAMAAWEDDRAPWLPATRALLAAAARRDLPTLGICLGAQLLALACGGRVERTPGGPEIGAVPILLDTRAPLLAGLPRPVRGIQWHLDSVTRLPAGATGLGGTPLCPYQAFQIGRRVYGVQFHPEADAGIVRGWMEFGAEIADRHGIDGDAALRELTAREPETTAAGATIAGNFASLLA